MERAQRDMERQLKGGGFRFGLAGNKLVAKRAAALAMAAALVAVPAVAFADQQAQAAQPAATQPATTDPGDNDVDFGKLTGVATVNGTSYDTVQDAVVAAKAGDTVTLVKDVTENVTVNKKLTITSEKGAALTGSLTLAKGAEGSVIDGVNFHSDGTVKSVRIEAGNVTVKSSHFTTPSAVIKAPSSRWTVDSIFVARVSNVTIQDNTFDLGRVNERHADGTLEGDGNSAINLVGAGVSDVIIKGNTVNATAAEPAATVNSSINLLIANGNTDGYGIQKVTVENNTFTGLAGAGNQRFAGLAGAEDVTFTDNTLSNLSWGVFQSTWDGKTHPNHDVNATNLKVVNVDNPFTVNTVQTDDQFKDAGAYVLTKDGSLTTYGWFTDAINEVNSADKYEDATIVVRKNVLLHKSFTINKRVTIEGQSKDYTFNGQLRLNASGTKVTGMHFVLDGGDLTFNGKAYESGLQQSVILSNKAEGIEVSGNTFDLPSLDKGDVEFQLSSVWLEQGVKGSKITGNEFNLGRAYNNSNVGINFVGAANKVISDTTVSDNTVKFTADKYSADHTDSFSGSVFFVVANGNRKGANDADYGIDGVTAAGNTIDGTAVPVKDFGVGISNVKGATFTGNTITGTSEAVRYSTYQGKSSSSTKLTFMKNTLKDNDANVDFKPFFEDGTMTPADFTYGGGDEANTVEVSKYAPRDPVVSGLAFTGWYDAQGNVATDESAPAYARLVPINYVIKQLGGSLNMENKSEDFKTTDLRLGYGVVAPNTGHKIDKWGWKLSYTNPKGEEKVLNLEGKNKRKPNASEINRVGADAVVTNALLTQLSPEWYGVDFSSALTVEYTTDDGTKVALMDSPFLTRSVKGVAERITAEGSKASQEEKDYAEGVLKVYEAQEK